MPRISRRRALAGVALGSLAFSALLTGCSRVSVARRPFTYVAIGASDAVGVGALEPHSEGWVPRFGAALGSATRVVNLGVNGSTLAQALEEQLGPAIDAEPDVVTIWLAVNDLNARVPLTAYERDLDRLLEAVNRPDRHVLVGNIPDLSRAPVYAWVDAMVLRGVIRQWNSAIERVVARHGVTLVDLESRWREISERPEFISSDGFHPSSAGYERLALIFEEEYRRGR